jgi:hypothetical protein
MLDNLILLNGRGKLCYFGPCSQAMHHFDAMGYPYPSYYNPGDYLLEVVSTYDVPVIELLIVCIYDNSNSEIRNARGRFHGV